MSNECAETPRWHFARSYPLTFLPAFNYHSCIIGASHSRADVPFPTSIHDVHVRYFFFYGTFLVANDRVFSCSCRAVPKLIMCKKRDGDASGREASIGGTRAKNVRTRFWDYSVRYNRTLFHSVVFLADYFLERKERRESERRIFIHWAKASRHSRVARSPRRSAARLLLVLGIDSRPRVLSCSPLSCTHSIKQVCTVDRSARPSTIAVDSERSCKSGHKVSSFKKKKKPAINDPCNIRRNEKKQVRGWHCYIDIMKSEIKRDGN